MKHIFNYNQFILEKKSNGTIVYHGSPHDFNYFSDNMIGSGEGVTGWGYGFYFTDDIDDAKDYARKLEREKGEGRLYKCRIPSSDMFLDISKSLDEQSEYVKNKLKSISNEDKIKILDENRMFGFDYDKFKYELDNDTKNGEYTWEIGDEKYNEFIQDVLDTEFMNIGNHFFSTLLEQAFGGEYEASQFLKEIGIKGNKHIGFHFQHYVVFDEDDIEIIKKTSPRFKYNY